MMIFLAKRVRRGVGVEEVEVEGEEEEVSRHHGR
jgi:hypothetical protein